MESLPEFLSEVLTTARGWTLIILGNLIGFVFAVAVLTISVVSFPLLLDRDVGAAIAVQTSIRAVLTNPMPMALWGLIVAGLLALGFATLMVGLAIIVPVLGHATWHLYRCVVERDSSSAPAMGKAGADSVMTNAAPPRREQGGSPGRIDPDLAAADAPGDRVRGENLTQRQEKLIDEAVEETYPASDPIAPKRITK